MSASFGPDILQAIEAIVRINNLQADTIKKFFESGAGVEREARVNNLHADTIKKLTETRYHPWMTAFAGFTGGAAVVGAVVALMKVLGG